MVSVLVWLCSWLDQLCDVKVEVLEDWNPGKLPVCPEGSNPSCTFLDAAWKCLGFPSHLDRSLDPPRYPQITSDFSGLVRGAWAELGGWGHC